MTTRTKEEQLLLDEKIARIQKKNEEILRRQKEIEEDKRLAEQQNAIVKLRPSTNVSRERTPALKPSKRELREDFQDNFEEPVIERNTRGSFRGRGGERYRGHGDWKTTGPPPDPRSFLYDDERDGPPRDRDGKGDLRRELDRKRSGDNREDNRGGREFHRGGRRDVPEFRTERGKRGGRGRGGRHDDEAWRAERLRIDEARIQRQRSADGKWRREWDNEKLLQEPDEEPRYESRRVTNQEQWHPPHQHHHNHPPHHHHHQCHTHGHGDHHHHSSHDTSHQPQPNRSRGRGRGRLDPSQLEMPLDIPIDLPQQKVSPRKNTDIHVEVSPRQRKLEETPYPTHPDESKFSGRRSIECVGDTVKISIPNNNTVQPPPKGQRRTNESRGRFRSQASYSSQSDEDSPRDRGQRGGRKQRVQKNPKVQEKTVTSRHESLNTTEPVVVDQQLAESKPPLPPFKLNQKGVSSTEEKDGDESWEDVTTSGAESMGEELVSLQFTSSKNQAAMVNANVEGVSGQSALLFERDVLDINTTGNLDEYLSQLECSPLSQGFRNEEAVPISMISETEVRIEPIQLQIYTESENQIEAGKSVIDVQNLVDFEELENILNDNARNLAVVSDIKESVLQNDEKMQDYSEGDKSESDNIENVSKENSTSLIKSVENTEGDKPDECKSVRNNVENDNKENSTIITENVSDKLEECKSARNAVESEGEENSTSRPITENVENMQPDKLEECKSENVKSDILHKEDQGTNESLLLHGNTEVNCLKKPEVKE